MSLLSLLKGLVSLLHCSLGSLNINPSSFKRKICKRNHPLKSSNKNCLTYPTNTSILQHPNKIILQHHPKPMSLITLTLHLGFLDYLCFTFAGPKCRWLINTLLTFHYTGWLIGILIIAYYNPYITGSIIPYITQPSGVLNTAQLLMRWNYKTPPRDAIITKIRLQFSQSKDQTLPIGSRELD